MATARKSISELNYSKSGAFLRTLAAKAGLPVALNDEDRALMELAYGEKWCGLRRQRSITPELDGQLREGAFQQDTGCGTNAVPYFFDVDLITYPLLTGMSCTPMVDVRNVPRGNSVHGASMQNPSVNWGTSEGTEIAMFDTSALIAALNTSIYNVTAAIEVGRDFLADSRPTLAGCWLSRPGKSSRRNSTV